LPLKDGEEARSWYAKGVVERNEIKGNAETAFFLPALPETVPRREWIQMPSHVRGIEIPNSEASPLFRDIKDKCCFVQTILVT
jgi:hypothetical protein